jgi:DNA invertase Pin-like site-specific DNA recombinase
LLKNKSKRRKAFAKYPMNKLRFVILLRVSTKQQGADGNGINAQRASIDRYLAAIKEPYEIVREYVEVITGSGKKVRPILLEAIKLAKDTGSKLLVSKLDRLSRSASMIFNLQDSKIPFVIADCPEANSLTIGLLAIIANYERSLISERTRNALAIVRQRGLKKLGNPNPQPALARAGQAIQARKRGFIADAMKSIQDIQSTGVTSLSQLALCMNKRGEKSSLGKSWNAMGIKRVLMANEQPITVNETVAI